MNVGKYTSAIKLTNVLHYTWEFIFRLQMYLVSVWFIEILINAVKFTRPAHFVGQMEYYESGHLSNRYSCFQLPVSVYCIVIASHEDVQHLANCRDTHQNKNHFQTLAPGKFEAWHDVPSKQCSYTTSHQNLTTCY